MRHKLYKIIYTLAIVAALFLLRDAVADISMASYWYLQIRYDRTNYTYSNAIAEVEDPHNLVWIHNR